jgi:hypothetical protein
MCPAIGQWQAPYVASGGGLGPLPVEQQAFNRQPWGEPEFHNGAATHRQDICDFQIATARVKLRFDIMVERRGGIAGGKARR